MTARHEDPVLEAAAALVDADRKVEKLPDYDPPESERAKRKRAQVWADHDAAQDRLLEAEATTDQGRFLKMVFPLCLLRASFEVDLGDYESLAQRVGWVLKVASHADAAMPILLRSPLLAGQREALRPYLPDAETAMVPERPVAGGCGMTINPNDAALMQQREAVRRLKDEINATDYDDDADLNAACEPLREMESEFMRTPAGTVKGLLVKLEVAFTETVGPLAPDLDKIYGELSGQAYLRAALEDARRLVTTG